MIAVDLFAGGGGFSEGFRQAGIQVSAAYEHWEPARLTHERNLPDTQAIRRNILELTAEEISEITPQVDILFGSPPCTEFSASKNGGKGDHKKGLECVFAFLRLVYYLQPRYWVMENVPRLERFLREHMVEGRIALRDIGIEEDGHLVVPVNTTMNALWFGVPQRRERLFMGAFPLPLEAEDPDSRPPLRRLGETLRALPDPEGQVGAVATDIIDPNYPQLRITSHELRDHYDQHVLLSEDEAYTARRLKQDHSWYGGMAFPDDLDLPARTILARQNRVSREAMYVPSSRLDGIRRLTIREMATLMGFPLIYQFLGDSDRLRLTQIGNAVCPPVAAAIGRAILADAGEAQRLPDPLFPVREPAPAAFIRLRSMSDEEKPERQNRVFRQHLPGLKVANRRVDIENSHAHDERPPNMPPPHPVAPDRLRHSTWWRSVLHIGIGGTGEARFKFERIDWRPAVRDFIAVTATDLYAQEAAECFLYAIADRVPLITPDATTLHARWARQTTAESSRPERLLDQLSDLVFDWFPPAGLGRERVMTREVTVLGLPRTMPLAVLASLVVSTFACECANFGIEWICQHPDEFYWPDPAGLRCLPDIEALRRAAPCLRQEFLEEVRQLIGEMRHARPPLTAEALETMQETAELQTIQP